MKRWIAIVCACLVVLGLFAGCQKPAQSQTPADSTQTTETAAPAEDSRSPEEAGPVTPMLFRVDDGKGGEMYLFGTIHVGDQRIDAALDRVVPYLDSCDALAVEFDIVAFEADMQAQIRSMTQFVYVDGSKVSDHMPKELFERASALLKKAGLFPSMMEQYNLSMWSQLVEQAALMTTCDLDFDGGMDKKLIRYCYDKKIEVRDVESPELQYGLLAGFSDELNLLLIENTLDHLDTYGESTAELYETWTRGSYEEILALLEGEEESEEEELTEDEIALLEDYNDKMLTQRNLGMRDVALSYLAEGKKVFFAVGAAHLVGEGGLVELLRAEGCTVEQITYEP